MAAQGLQLCCTGQHMAAQGLQLCFTGPAHDCTGPTIMLHRASIWLQGPAIMLHRASTWLHRACNYAAPGQHRACNYAAQGQQLYCTGPAIMLHYGIWGNMGFHYPADLSLVTYGLRLEVYDEARPKHLTISLDPVSAG